MDHAEENGRPQKDVTVEIDGVRVTSPRDTTAADLLAAAGLDSATRQLVLVHGRHQTPYEETSELKLHAEMVFITVATGPTPVS